jgi:hypothetical protein
MIPAAAASSMTMLEDSGWDLEAFMGDSVWVA